MYPRMLKRRRSRSARKAVRAWNRNVLIRRVLRARSSASVRSNGPACGIAGPVRGDMGDS